MARRKKTGKKSKEHTPKASLAIKVSQKTKEAVFIILLVLVGSFLTLAAFHQAGIAGTETFGAITYFLGIGYFLLPLLLFVIAGLMLFQRERPGIKVLQVLAGILFLLSSLAAVDIIAGHGGVVGDSLGKTALYYFNFYASLVLLGGLCLVSLIVLFDETALLSSLAFMGKKTFGLLSALTSRFSRKDASQELADASEEVVIPPLDEEDEVPHMQPAPVLAQKPLPTSASEADKKTDMGAAKTQTNLRSLLETYTPPPLSLLEQDKGRPGVGDIKANANIIKRTLQNFGIVVELDEISIGPSVTRYAIKPAEGVRLQKIVSLQPNLELALAAHPVRIEAPIPGKSLVGIEVPNHAKVTVGLGSLLQAPAFGQSPKPLLVALGRDIAGESHFGNLAKMPHVLIAGATGSGKSVTIHALITSLLYRCGPQQMRFLMIDPKRVELTLYNRIPHLLSPVITDAKKAIIALRWAGKEMERRYNVLEQERVRDIDSYHQNILAPALKKLRDKGSSVAEGEAVPEAMPYIVIVIDELADIMQTFPRELEAAVVRLAQMSRAVGIHLILSTQRPSVNVITGLIKANVPSRIALQVASQIDSRTILDQAGAEKLLGAGDMLYLSGDMGKPIRLQSAFISEGEVKKVTDFIAKNNDDEVPVDIGIPPAGSAQSLSVQDSSGFGDDDEIDDDLYEAARGAVTEAGKASTSYLQRKLRVGYARAARLMDVLEERGVIGPQDGAKPREILGGGKAPDMLAEKEIGS